MDVSYVNPFIKATVETFKTMLNLDLVTGTPMLKKDAEHSYDVSGVFGLSGEAQGVISISSLRGRRPVFRWFPFTASVLKRNQGIFDM